MTIHKKIACLLLAVLLPMAMMTSSGVFRAPMADKPAEPDHTTELATLELRLAEKAQAYRSAKPGRRPDVYEELLGLQKERELLGGKGKVYLMSFSPQGRELLKQFEIDLSSELRVFQEVNGKRTLTGINSYQDKGGISVGFGHFVGHDDSYNGERARLMSVYGIDAAKTGVMVPIEEALQIFEEDIASFSKTLCLWQLRNGVELNQAQFDALLMYSFQQGKYIWDMEGTGTLVKFLEEHPNGASDPALAEQIRSCFGVNFRAKPFSGGLKSRHLNEANLFLTGSYEKIF